MTDLIYNHITARIPGSKDHLLINLYGMLYKEITASSLSRPPSTCRSAGRPSIVSDLGPHDALVMRNHGLLRPRGTSSTPGVIKKSTPIAPAWRITANRNSARWQPTRVTRRRVDWRDQCGHHCGQSAEYDSGDLKRTRLLFVRFRAAKQACEQRALTTLCKRPAIAPDYCLTGILGHRWCSSKPAAELQVHSPPSLSANRTNTHCFG